MAALKLSAAFPTTLNSAQHIQWAEELGYDSAFLFDTPFDGGDVWLRLHEAADRTEHIELGPGVLVPTSRHPLVNAANTLSLHRRAPGRVTVGFGTGFSSRAALGQPAVTWSYMERYITTYQALLAGEAAEWEGAAVKLMLPSELRDQVPLRVPILVSTLGPKGNEVAHRVGAAGTIGMLQPSDRAREHQRALFVVMGTVLDPSEKITDDRVKNTVGPIWALNYHFAYTLQGRDAAAELPGGTEWLKVIEQAPHDQQHLLVHQGHFVELNSADEAGWAAGGYSMLEDDKWTNTAANVHAAVQDLAGHGVTEVQLQTTGPDIRRELAAFKQAVENGG